MNKLISFEKLKEVCEDKLFEHRGNCHYFIKCKRGIPFCNERVCPIWNELEEQVGSMSLREINRRIANNGKSVSIHADEGQQNIQVPYKKQALPADPGVESS